ncbi:unnamed protein product [Ambrosiozyma monospora]|uniref:Unnamed protein product n=1 Tax=Ambrosiozyma monospora TaxID=43982 RepID=A0ACB5TZB1_AMBMO|nr:unnamed protein product [Ambrosiozyma monospora]
MSANYCHVGSVKKWYGIPANECDLFESIFHECAPDYFQKQPDLLHQLVSLLSPNKLVEMARSKKGKTLHVYHVDQGPNEFVITFPKVYHAGFNCGFNINEAVNFTMPFWLHYGQDALNEYKLVKKEAVFNYYKLLRNIMDDILVNKDNHSFSRDTIREMIRISFTDYCSQIREYSTALTNYDLVRFVTTIEKKIDYDELVKQVIARNEEKRKRSRGRMSRKRLANEEAEEIDEFICNDSQQIIQQQ